MSTSGCIDATSAASRGTANERRESLRPAGYPDTVSTTQGDDPAPGLVLGWRWLVCMALTGGVVGLATNFVLDAGFPPRLFLAALLVFFAALLTWAVVSYRRFVRQQRRSAEALSPG